ncbi:hypothetical protein [Mycobacterium sp. 3519A]|uniref:hypothetical protein n=1 Tax=Mycobacterium sp. 3519A TaxID=2057184 RepID=UPI000C7B1F61|nr:hypothetical protein [Mycobacterium sp. 3519A]
MTQTTLTARTTTDGLRGVPGTHWSEMDILAEAIACGEYLGATGAIVIGFDGRAGSAELAAMCADHLLHLDIDVTLSASPTVTPAVGRFCASRSHVTGGLIFTASHNPPGYVGVKMRGHDGLAYDTAPFVDRATIIRDDWGIDIRYPSWSRRHTSDAINDLYAESVLADLNATIDSFGGDVTIDSMYGAAGRYQQFVPSANWRRATVAPFFFGIVPDPVQELSSADDDVIAAVGPDQLRVLTDGDGDRIALITRQSGYISSTELALCLLDGGATMQNVISTVVSEKLLADSTRLHGKAFSEVEVGFKNVIAEWNRLGRPAAMGVEPNGGLAIANDAEEYFERDGLWAAARVLTELRTVRALNEAVSAVRERRRFRQLTLSTSEGLLSVVNAFVDRYSRFESLSNGSVYQLVCMETGERVLLRQSGTESVTRIYVEADTDVAVWLTQTFSHR